MSSSTTDAVVDVLMPQLGTSMSEGTVVAWTKAVGDRVERDEAICEISTDKIDSDCPAPVAGVLTEILVEPGQTVDTGTPLARIATEGAAASGAAAPTPPRADASPPPAEAAGGRSPTTPTPAGPPRRRYSPVVKRMAAIHEIDLEAVTPSGRGGRVTKRDVEAYLARSGGAEPRLHSDSPYRADAPAPGGVPHELSRMRRSIGAAMRASLDTAATCTTVVECDMTAVERRRAELGTTALPVVARHAVDALREYPDLNATLEGTTLTRYDHVDLGVAVSLGDDGLIVPVVRGAQELAPAALAARIKQLAAAARERTLSPDDVRGATFTITSPGAFGALMATPIINVPQVAILDLEAIVRRPVVVSDADGNEAIAIRSMAYLCLSWDHRALDGAYAARFLSALRRRIEAG